MSRTDAVTADAVALREVSGRFSSGVTAAESLAHGCPAALDVGQGVCVGDPTPPRAVAG